MIKIVQATIERLLYVILFLVFVINIAIFVKLQVDDARKFKILRSNQNTLICVVIRFTQPPVTQADVNNCIAVNR